MKQRWINFDWPAARDERGAVYVEFLIAFIPFFVFFLCLWQVSILYTTKLVVDHAAFAAARAAAVVVAENPRRIDPDGGKSSVNQLTASRDDYVRTAAEIALTPLIVDGTIFTVDVKYPKPDQPGGADSMHNQTYPGMTESSVSLMRARVEVVMNCKIALANAILCPPNSLLGWALNGLGVFVLPVQSEAVFPYQGASYEYNPDDDDGHAGSGAVAGNQGGFCFAAGTLVDTIDGLRPIEQIQTGDIVVSRNDVTGETRREPVLRTFVSPRQPLVELTLNGCEKVRVTPGHLFWAQDRGWTAAAYLEDGEILVGEDDPVRVTAAVSLIDAATVYNFEVENTHTYFVGAGRAWVHNPQSPPPGASNSCAQPPTPNPHGRCSDQQWAGMYPPMKAACGKPRSCSTADDCASATAKVSAGYACVSGREAIQSKCYSPGDPGYEGHMNEIAQTYAALRKCDAMMKQKCQ